LRSAALCQLDGYGDRDRAGLCSFIDGAEDIVKGCCRFFDSAALRISRGISVIRRTSLRLELGISFDSHPIFKGGDPWTAQSRKKSKLLRRENDP